MATSLRSVLACVAFATLGLAYACGDTTPGSTRDTSGSAGAPTPSTASGKGGFTTLDDSETFSTGNITGGATTNMTWRSRDGRNGAWHQYRDTATAAGTMSLEPSGGGGSPDSVQAMHYKGNRGTYGAALAIPLGGAAASGEAGCYDASVYDGISFWIKGNAAAGNTQIKFNVQTPVSEPEAYGGACTSGCSDHFSTIVPIPATWTRVKVPWADLKRQACAASV